MIVTGDNQIFLEWFISQLSKEFAMKDLGFIHYFLGIEVIRFDGGLHLSQCKYASDLLARAQMNGCKPLTTPMVLKKPTQARTDPYPDVTHY